MEWSTVWPAAAGALAQEVLHWYRLRTRLERPEYQRLLRSRAYWVITAAMIAMSSFGTALIYGTRSAGADELFVLGAAFPMIFKKLVAAAGERAAASDALEKPRSSWRAYLGVA